MHDMYKNLFDMIQTTTFIAIADAGEDWCIDYTQTSLYEGKITLRVCFHYIPLYLDVFTTNDREVWKETLRNEIRKGLES